MQAWLEKFIDLVERNGQGQWKEQLVRKARDMQRYVLEQDSWRQGLAEEVKLLKNQDNPEIGIRQGTLKETEAKLAQSAQMSGIGA